MKKLIIGTVVGFSIVHAVKYGIVTMKEALDEFAKRERERAIDKTVDDFVKAVVFNKIVTIDSKHNGSVTVRMIK
ncbi:MAG: hypothetical protein VZR24_15295 [Butyrivibrio hungatei]|nr:hypothetical protein [Butyrivibrio hungatei]